MLLQVRVSLPDQPGSLGRVARTLGAAGADIVQILVLERNEGRAVDDFTITCARGASIDMLCDALSSVQGVRVEGVWTASEPPGTYRGLEVIGQVAANPAQGVGILVDAAAALLGADWAAMVMSGADRVPSDRGEDLSAVVHTSWKAPDPLDPPEVSHQRPHAFTGEDGTRYAAVPAGHTGLMLLVARVAAPPFHRSEVDRLTHLVAAAAAVMGDQLDDVATPRLGKA